jgi:hypothetical protein
MFISVCGYELWSFKRFAVCRYDKGELSPESRKARSKLRYAAMFCFSFMVAELIGGKIDGAAGNQIKYAVRGVGMLWRVPKRTRFVGRFGFFSLNFRALFEVHFEGFAGRGFFKKLIVMRFSRFVTTEIHVAWLPRNE